MRTITRSATTTITVNDDATSEEMEVRNLPEHIATAEVGLGITKNLGDYNSLRISVNISYPCHPDVVVSTTRQVARRVRFLLEEQLIKALGE